MLYRWPAEGWVRGRVVRVSRAAVFSHVVRVSYGRADVGARRRCGPAGSLRVASLLDARPQARTALLVGGSFSFPLVDAAGFALVGWP